MADNINDDLDQDQNTNLGQFSDNDSNRASTAGKKGGRAAHDKGNAHELTDEERRRGGQIGGSR